MVFTARICCCSATAASKIMAFVALILTGWVCFNSWWNVQWIGVSIWQSILCVILMFACVLVFMACSRRNPRLMVPIIIIQLINFLSVLFDAVYDLIWFSWDYDLGTWLYTAGLYAITIIVSAFILHCHVCCYKLLILKAHHHHHGGV
ncbi:hypothetical protein PRIPAC_77526 [Pristionchus pacificus]|nr:hypothetical protein PRIPAC_77526 [Pristionchus pacificus]